MPFSQFERMVAAAKKEGKTLQTLELDDTHNLLKEENELKFYETLLAFLEQHNPADSSERGKETSDPSP